MGKLVMLIKSDHIKNALLFIAAIVIAFLLWPAPSNTANTANPQYKVTDGDTIQLPTGQYVRIIGINTPEVDQCGYQEAKTALSQLIGTNTPTLVNPTEVDDKDKYGRLLRYVEVGSQDLGLTLLNQGLAEARYDSLDGYGYHPRQDQYHQTASSQHYPSTCN